MNHKQRY